MKKVATHQAKTHLSALIKEVETGEEVVIMRGNTPVAKLVPIKTDTGFKFKNGNRKRNKERERRFKARMF